MNWKETSINFQKLADRQGEQTRYSESRIEGLLERGTRGVDEIINHRDHLCRHLLGKYRPETDEEYEILRLYFLKEYTFYRNKTKALQAIAAAAAFLAEAQAFSDEVDKIHEYGGDTSEKYKIEKELQRKAIEAIADIFLDTRKTFKNGEEESTECTLNT